MQTDIHLNEEDGQSLFDGFYPIKLCQGDMLLINQHRYYVSFAMYKLNGPSQFIVAKKCRPANEAGWL